MISILDILNCNPVSRIPFTKFEKLATLRKEIAGQVRTTQRFQALQEDEKMVK